MLEKLLILGLICVICVLCIILQMYRRNLLDARKEVDSWKLAAEHWTHVAESRE